MGAPRIPALWSAGLATLFALATLPASGSAVSSVVMADLGFKPDAVRAKVGDRVEWRNDDFVDHTATAADGSWEVVVKSGMTGGITLDHAGTIAYFCRYHPQMKARIEVTR